MFHAIPDPIRKRMAVLEAIDSRDRVDGTLRAHRLRQIPPETGRFIALMAAAAPEGAFLEVGTSAGYSSLWLGLACRARGATLVTFEPSADKAELAAQTFAETGMEAVVQLVRGDARDFLAQYEQVAFCFLDAEKELYLDCYEQVIPNLVPGGFFLADNFTSHQEELEAVRHRALGDQRLEALVVPVGKGILLCRKSS